jgi:serine/threonine protein kinase
METGFGIEVSHRDGVYPEKRFFFKNEELMLEWMELFKFYKGESVQKRYEIGEKIGTGKFSVVYRCVNVEEDKEYALKEIATFKL